LIPIEIPSGFIFSGGDTLGTASKAMYPKPMMKMMVPAMILKILAPLINTPIKV
jgi:hypothetical protein